MLREQDALVPAIRAGGTLVHSLGAAHNARSAVDGGPCGSLLVTGNYDVVHFHLPYAAALGQLVVASLPRSARPAVVYTEHSLWDRAKLVNRALLRSSMANGERLVAVSQASYDALPAPLRRRATTVVHGVDLSRSDSLIARRGELRDVVRSELAVDDDEFLFLTVANLRPEKGYDVLLDAATVHRGHRASPSGLPRSGRGPLKVPPSAPVTQNWTWEIVSSSSASATTCCGCWRARTPSSWPRIMRGFPWR